MGWSGFTVSGYFVWISANLLLFGELHYGTENCITRNTSPWSSWNQITPPPFLFQPPNSAGLSNWGLSSRVAEKSKWWQEAFWGNSSLPHFLSSKKETLKCDITQGTFHLGHRRKALGVLAGHPEWGIFLNFMVDGKWQKWEWPSGAVSVKFRLQGACSTVDSAWVMQKQFRVHVWN